MIVTDRPTYLDPAPVRIGQRPVAELRLGGRGSDATNRLRGLDSLGLVSEEIAGAAFVDAAFGSQGPVCRFGWRLPARRGRSRRPRRRCARSPPSPRTPLHRPAPAAGRPPAPVPAPDGGAPPLPSSGVLPEAAGASPRVSPVQVNGAGPPCTSTSAVAGGGQQPELVVLAQRGRHREGARRDRADHVAHRDHLVDEYVERPELPRRRGRHGRRAHPRWPGDA